MKHHYRWFIGLLLFFAGALNYLDRAAMSVAAPLIKHDLGFSDAEMGVLFSAFFVGYCVFCFVGGWCADRFGPRRVFAVAAAVWSFFCGATALMSSFTQLLVVRMLFGIGEGPMGTTTNKSIANWFPRDEAGRAVGLTAIGQPLGAALAAPLVGLLAVNFSWRIAFVATGFLGLVWLVAWLVFFRDTPAQHPRVSEQERALIQCSRAQLRAVAPSDAGDAHEVHGVWHYVLSKRVLAVAFAFFSFNYVLYFLLSWLPSYLTDFQHLDIRHMAVVGAIPWLGASVGLALGGVASDWLTKRTGNAPRARKGVIVVGLCGSAACVLMASRAATVTPAVALIAAAALFAFMTPQTCWVLIQEIVPGSRVGAAGGFVHLVANLAGILAPGLTGWLVQYGGGYRVAFCFAATLAAAGALGVIVLLRPFNASHKRSVDGTVAM